MSIKAKALKKLYDSHKITIEGVRKAVVDHIITPEEFTEITGEVYGEE